MGKPIFDECNCADLIKARAEAELFGSFITKRVKTDSSFEKET
jgi:hypothetical protein